MKRTVLWTLTAAIMLSLTACGGGGADSSTAEGGTTEDGQEIMDVRWVLPSADSDDLEKVTEAINAKLKEDGLPLNFVPMGVPSNVYDDRINMMFAAGEEFELLHVMENVTPSTVYVNNDYIIPIDDLLDEYGQDIKNVLNEDTDWLGTKINGSTYTVPNHWKDITKSVECGAMGFRLDKLEEYGLEMPTNRDELFDMALELKEKWGEKDAYLWMCEPGDANARLHRDFDRFPFYVDFDTSLMMIFQDGTVEPYLESPEFEEEAKWMQKAYQAGLIHPDILTITNDERNKIVNAGISLGGNLGDYEYAQKARESGSDPNYTYGIGYLNPDAPVLESIAALNSNAVSSTSPHPEAGIMFLNWLYADPANMQLLAYGIEGEHYTVADNGRFEFVRDENGALKYELPFWQFGYSEYMAVDVTAPEEYEWYMTEPWDNVEVGAAMGFVFDPTPVQSQYQAILAELPGTIEPIKMGVQDYDTYFPAALEKLKSLGYDEVVAEYTKQFTEFYQSNH